MQISFILVVVTIFIFVLHNIISVGHSMHQLNLNKWAILLAVLLPIGLYITTLVHFRIGKSLELQQILNMLVATFCSMAMITGGHGMVEYHFSIFMVLAIISYYEKTKLLLIMNALFVIQHLVGFFFMSAYVFGAVQGDYGFGMLLYHALFLIGTSGALIWQIEHKKGLRNQLDNKIEEQQQLTSLISNMQLSSEQLFQASNSLQNVYNQSLVGLDKIVVAVNTISVDTKHHSHFSDETSQLVEHIVEGLQDITEANNNVVSRTRVMAERANDGVTLIYNTVEQMTQFEQQFKQYASDIARLTTLTNDVAFMADVIQGISKQTKLLSLNANIEASRAGEHGRGFSVVAVQIGKLAEDSHKSAINIMSVLANIQKETNYSINSTMLLIDQVNEAVSQNKAMVSILQEIKSLVDDSIKQYATVSSSIHTIASSTDDANNAVIAMSGLASTINRRTHDVSDVSKQQQRLNEQLSPFIQSLIKISQRLTEQQK